MVLIFKDLNHLFEISNWFSEVGNETEEMTDALNRQGKSYRLLIFICTESGYPELRFFCSWEALEKFSPFPYCKSGLRYLITELKLLISIALNIYHLIEELVSVLEKMLSTLSVFPCYKASAEAAAYMWDLYRIYPFPFQRHHAPPRSTSWPHKLISRKAPGRSSIPAACL